MNKNVKQRIFVEIIIGVIAVLIVGYLFSKWEAGPQKNILSIKDPAVKASIEKNEEKLLIIGIDGATWDVALSLLGAGRMPHLENLLKQGAHGDLISTRPFISPAIWTSFATGYPREVHGIDNFLYKIPFQYKMAQAGVRIRRVPALWNILSAHGKKVGVVNWYAAHPAESLPAGGVFVSEGIQPGKLRPDQVFPAEWLERIEKLDPFSSPLMEDRLLKYQHPVVTKGYELDRFVATISADILREVQPDLMMIYLQNLDVVCHGFWKYRFPVGLEYYYPVSQAERKKFGDVIDTYYEYTDWLIGKLVDAAPGYNVMILSDHGFEATYPPKNIFFNLNRLLEQMGYLEFGGQTCEEFLKGLLKQGSIRVAEPVSYNVFFTCESLKQIMRRPGDTSAELVAGFLLEHNMIQKRDLASDKFWRELESLAVLLRQGHEREDVEWHKTRAFNMEDFHKNVQGIFINLNGRDPQGVVPEDEFKSFREKLMSELRHLRTERDTPVLKKVQANPEKGLMPMGESDPPDILVEFNRDILGDEFIKRHESDPDPIPLGSILWSYSDVSGDHSLEGIWLISGPGTADFEHYDARVLDIAPTILWLLGFPPGADMPGDVIRGAFSKDRRDMEVIYIETWRDMVPFGTDAAPSEISPEKREQMRSLGYIQH